MKNRNREVKASFLYLLGNISTKAISFLTIPIFTRLLTTAEYGVVNTYTSWVHIVTVVMTLSLYNSFRMAYVEKRGEFESYCASVIRLSGIFTIAALLLSAVTVPFLPFIKPVAWMVPCCIVQAYGMFCVNSMSAKHMLEFRYRRRAAYMLLPNIFCASLALLFLLTHEQDRAFWRIQSYVLVYAAFIVIALVSTRKGKTRPEYWRYAVTYSLPLVFHGLSLVVLASSDRIMITHITGASASGIYSLVYNLGLIATALISSIEGLWVPWFIRKYWKNEIEDINRKAKYFIENVTAVVVCVMLVAPEVLQIMAPEKYWSGKPIIFPVVAASYVMFLYDLAVNVEYQSKATKAIAANTMMAAGLNIVLNLVFIPMFGAIAAAYTTLTAYLASMALHYYKARKLKPGIFPMKEYLPFYAIVAVFCVIGEFTYDIRFAAVRWVLAVMIFLVYAYLMFFKKRFVALQIRIETKSDQAAADAVQEVADAGY